MAFWDNLTQKASQTTAKAVQKAKDLSEVAKLNSLITSEEGKINNTYSQIGKLYMSLHLQDYEDEFSGMINSIIESEQKIRDYQQQIQDAQNSGTQIEEPNAEAERQARIEAKQEEINNTIVYAVNSGAKYYHAVQVCGNQSNRRSLTVREAILEGLGACSDCNPPSPSDAEALIDAEDAAASGETPAE